ncbi:MAG TPA: FAD-dependent monooxygenase [Stellaceae bacterium]|nr:FAD-dependent monooxygenase [Stellaceae bacterium]
MARGRILIVGAGLGGLSAAACLLRAGFEVSIFEQAPALAEIGAGIQVSANAMHVLRHLGLEPAIAELGVRPGAYVFRLHDTGEIVQQFPLSAEHERRHGAPYVQLHRADLHELLASAVRALAPDAIHLGMKAVGFSESSREVELRFADGSVARGDALVGADGLKSMIARQIVGEVTATYTGDAAWRLTVPVERLPKPFLDPVMTLFLGPGGHAVCYYIRRGKLLNFVGCVETEDVAEESWTVKFPWERLHADYLGWHSEVQAIVDAADRGMCFRWSLHNRLPLRNWSTARATLLGDSAHATLPYLAQGAAMAIEDGAVLARALSEAASVPEALDLYQRNRVDRTARVVRESTENRRLYHLGSAEEIRAEFGQRDLGADRNAWLYPYNPLTVELK